MLAHPEERALAARPCSSAHEDPLLLHPLTHPAGLPLLASMVAGGALRVPPVTDVQEVRPGDELDVPGSPVVVFSPGHTFGHCALLLPGHGDPWRGGARAAVAAARAAGRAG